MNIVGLDVGKHGKSVGWLISELHLPLSAYYSRNRKDAFTIYPDNAGLDHLLSLKPDGIIMEPTGTWYSSLWARAGEVYNIPIYWMGHADLYCQRGHFKFTNKFDDIDALVLASTYFDNHWVDDFGRPRWLNSYRSEPLETVRQIFWEYRQMLNLRGVIARQLHQRLSYEFPELAGTDFDRSESHGQTPKVQKTAG